MPLIEAETNSTYTGAPEITSCQNCGMNVVCIAYRATARLLQEQFKEDVQPFSVDDLAKICRFSVSNTAVVIAKKGLDRLE
jgi:hypothetical protein